MPAEWAPHASTWIAWPSHAELWQDHLTDARAAFVELATAIAEGETLEILVPDEPSERLARAALPASRVRFHRVPFGDIWLRDTAPLFLVSADGRGATVRFGFNGWGGKYVLDHDDGRRRVHRSPPRRTCAARVRFVRDAFRSRRAAPSRSTAKVPF